MKIVVNTRLLLADRLEGIGWFSFETLKRMTRSHPEHEFVFLFDRPFSQDFIFSDNIRPVVLSPQARHPILYYIWFEWSVYRFLKKEKPDLFLSPDGYLSLRTSTPSLPVIHDLNFEHYPQDLPPLTRRFYTRNFPKYARKAIRIATVSEFSKQDIVTQYGVDPKKVDVVYNGANMRFAPASVVDRQRILEQYTHGLPFFVFVGSLHPRKNLVNLFKAYDQFREKSGSPVKLLIVGVKKWWTKDIEEAYEAMRNKDCVIFSGRVGSEELRLIIGSALALTYVSYFEGFGIPIIEAYRCETPVITSNVTSMPEIAGDAAILVDPFNIEEITEAMLRLFRDKALCKKLIERGRIRKQVFTWDRSAERLWKSIVHAVEDSKKKK